MPLLTGRGQSIGSHGGPAMVSPLTCALLPVITTPLSKPVIVPGPFKVIPVSSGATLTPRDVNSGTWQLPANPEPVRERVCPARSSVTSLAVISMQVASTTAMSAASAYAPGAPSVRHPLTGVGPAIAVDGNNVSTASVTANTTAAERLEHLIPQPLVDCLSRPGVWQPGIGRSWGTVPQVFGPSQVSCVEASALPSPSRDRTPSFRYAEPSWFSTVLAVTKRDWAISRLVIPRAAIWATRPSLAVRAPGPATARRRGRAPEARSSSSGHPAIAPAQRRPQLHQGSRALQDRLGRLQDIQRRFEQLDAALASLEATGCPKRDALASSQPTPPPERQLVLNELHGLVELFTRQRQRQRRAPEQPQRVDDSSSEGDPTGPA